MVGIHQEVIYGVTRLRAIFIDDIGNQKVITGTGFWPSNIKGKKMFVTNKHNVDPTLILGKGTTFKLNSLSIELRRTVELRNSIEGGEQIREISAETCFFQVEKPLDFLRVSETADCAIIVEPKFTNPCDEYVPLVLPTIYEIGTPEFLETKVQIMDTVSFIGFPGKEGAEWWDKEWMQDLHL